MSQEKIYEPFIIKNLRFKSRIVMAPITPFGIPSGEANTLGKEMLEYYRKRIQGELGLLITQCFSVIPGDHMLGSYSLCNERQKEDLSTLADMCHQNDTRIFAQISYPSIGHHRHEKIDHWTTGQLKEIENAFVHSALLAREAGYDGIEIHGANMFFLNLFSSPISNTRTDKYGGDLQGRLRLALTIIQRIKEFADDSFIVSYRMGWNIDLDTDILTARALKEAGIDLLHFSYGIREADRIMPKEYPPVICYPGSSREKQISPADFEYNDVVYTGAIVRKNVNIPMILVDELWTVARGEALLETGAGDFAAFGRPFLADEDFLIHAKGNPNFGACYRCPACAWFDDWTRCPCYRKRKKE